MEGVEPRTCVDAWRREIAAVITIVAVGFSTFELYTGLFGERVELLQRGACLGFSLALVFLLTASERSVWLRGLDVVLAGIGGFSGLYLFLFFEDILNRAGTLTTFELWLGVAVVLLVLEATRRLIGWALPIVGGVFVAYAYVGPYLPGLLGHRGYRLDRIISSVYIGEEGIYGVPIGVASTFVFMFVLLGAFLQRSGAGKFLTELAFGLTGQYRGGPAKVSVVSSALFGTMSGSAVANASAVGNFSIPLMLQLGYRPPFAAAIEALSSLGGQLMPPVMGSAAFVMVEFTGISYTSIAAAAAIPAIIYFTTVFFIVDFEAAKLGLKGLPKSELPSPWKTFKEGWLLLSPIVVLFVLLFEGFSVFNAAFWMIPFTYAVTALRPSLRMDLRKVIAALKDGALGILPIVLACSAAGVVIGVASMTGLALSLSNALVVLSGGHLFALLVLTMIASLILGMGLPTVACYIMLAVLVAPALEQLGIPLLAAHLFIFYFGIIGAITPPVAVVAYTTAALARANPMEVGVTAFKLGFALYILPYVWAYAPELLGEGDLWRIVIVVLSSTLGCYLFVAAIQGWLLGRCGPLDRILLALAGLGFVHVGSLTDLLAVPLAVFVVARQWFACRRHKAEATAPRGQGGGARLPSRPLSQPRGDQ
ncbi:MAG: TRAP transporter permease [Proteobacteria bacterium]|nr:TRAP transporter permease [Pseudomonadota bacterium]